MQTTRCLPAVVLAALLAPLLGLAGPTHEIVAKFDVQPSTPSNGALVLAPDGYYWGAATVGGAFGSGAIYKVKADGSDWQTVLSFSGNGAVNKGQTPSSALVSDGAGFLWGTTKDGGTSNFGTVFKVEVSTGSLTTVVNFLNTAPAKGRNPLSALVAHGGFLWGTTQLGGASNYGTIFKINPATGALTTVVELAGTSAPKGREPYGALVSDGVNSLWGTTLIGGASNLGTVFRVNAPDGAFETMFEFTGTTGGTLGSRPEAGLVRDGTGRFWGTTTTGGPLGWGTIFKVYYIPAPDPSPRWVLETVIQFGDNAAVNKGRTPAAPLMYDNAGFLWGMTAGGPGPTGFGMLYKLSVNAGVGATPAEITTLLSFTNTTGSFRGRYPRGGLVQDGTGKLWGTTPFGGSNSAGTVFRLDPAAEPIATGFETLVSFDGSSSSHRGVAPYGAVFGDGGDSLWATTYNGGAGTVGTVSKFSATSGTGSAPVEFTGNGATNKGSYPRSSLVSDGLGFYWGTTEGGGTTGMGTIFKISAATGALTTVATFTGNGATNKGEGPLSGLVRDGNFMWGTTVRGGTLNYGTIFKISTSAVAPATVTTVVEFAGSGTPNRGAYPYGLLVKDNSGFFWGTTEQGGVPEVDLSLGKGTVFKVSANAGAGSSVTTIAEFVNAAPATGMYPVAGLVHDGAGNLWGTTRGISGTTTHGTIYRVSEAAAAGSGVTTVVTFTGTGATNRGSYPWAPMVSDGAGNLWGTTNQLGTTGFGSIFRIATATNTLTTVHEFTGIGPQAGSGSRPGYGALFRHVDGNFYGTTYSGGPGGAGTLYRLRFGPSPVTQPAAGVSFVTATLQGTLNPNGNQTAASFEYGTNPQLAGATVVGAGVVMAGTAPVAVSAPLTGLAWGTTYYYRIVGSNAENPIAQKGAILSFSTLPNASPIVTLLGLNPLTVEAGPAYVDPGANATDAEDGSLTPVIFSNTVNMSVPGSYSVTWRATDSLGAAATALRTVNVVDTTGPAIVPPPGPIVEATGPFGAVVSFPAANVTDAVGVTSVVYSHSSGSVFPLGQTIVTITARDATNNTTEGSFTVTVRDTIAPVVTAPASMLVGATGPSGAAVNFPAASASDIVGVTSITYSPPSGSTIPLGTTVVTVTARDASNNAGTAQFSVTVVPAMDAWRYQYFGSTSATGIAAPDADPDFDGLPNVLEFATNTNPTVPNSAPSQVAMSGHDLELIYTRSKAAMGAGIVFVVEWADALPATSWSTSGVTETILSQNATVQVVKASMSPGIGPLGFMRLRIVQP